MQGHRFSRFVRRRKYRGSAGGFASIVEHARPDRQEDHMWLAPSVEPSLTDILDEPIVQALMARDSVTRADVMDAVRQAGY